MTIEDVIKQTRFKNNYHKLALNLMYTVNWLEAHLKEIFKEEGITNQQYNILRILRGSMPTPLSTLQIRERMMDKMSDTSRIVDRLVIKKLVSKKTCPNDNRLVDIRITEKGLTLLSKLDNIENRIAELFGNLSEKEALIVSDYLDRLHEPKFQNAEVELMASEA
ncbi:MAG: MarR family transcriptional regulator [Niabella sp.]